jgi:hypothetical protein
MPSLNTSKTSHALKSCHSLVVIRLSFPCTTATGLFWYDAEHIERFLQHFQYSSDTNIGHHPYLQRDLGSNHLRDIQRKTEGNAIMYKKPSLEDLDTSQIFKKAYC